MSLAAENEDVMLRFVNGYTPTLLLLILPVKRQGESIQLNEMMSMSRNLNDDWGDFSWHVGAEPRGDEEVMGIFGIPVSEIGKCKVAVDQNRYKKSLECFRAMESLKRGWRRVCGCMLECVEKSVKGDVK